MPRLKQAVIDQIYSALDNQFFSRGDFEVDFPDRSGAEFAIIKFRHKPAFSFAITELRSDNIGEILGPLSPATIEIPGDYKTREVKRHESFDACIGRIHDWCSNLRDDLRAGNPLAEELDQFRQRLEQHIDQHLNDPEANFSPDELERLNARFDELYQEFKTLSERHAVTEEQLREIRKEFGIIKEDANHYSKGLWASLTKNRLVSLVGKLATSKEGRQLLYEATKRLLGLGTGAS